MSIAEKLVTVAENQQKVYDAGFKKAIDRYCPVFTESGASVTCNPVENYPLGVISGITPIQAGSGDASPTNIRPITAHTSVTVNRCGANMWDITRFLEANSWAIDEDGAYYGKPSSLRNVFRQDKGGFIKGCFNSNTSYTIRIESKCPTNANGTIMFYAYYTDGTSAILAVPKNNTEYTILTGTTANNKTLDCIGISYNYDDTTYVKSITLCEGTVATTEPYQADIFTAQLGQDVYAGNFNWSTGVLTLTHKLLTLTGQESVSIWKTGSTYVYTTGLINDHVKTSQDISGWCSHVATTEKGSVNYDYLHYTNASVGGVLFGSVGAFWQVTEVTAESWVAYLAEQYDAGTPVQILYKLGTPITVQLTPQEILALDGVNTVYSNTGNTTVTGKGDGVAMVEELKDIIISLGGEI